MKTTIKEQEDKVVAILKGSLDTAVAEETERALNPLNDVVGKDIIIDCTHLEYISSSGLRTFLGILLFTNLPSDLVFLGVVGVLFCTGVLDVDEALSGFSSTTVAVVGVMFIVVAGLTHTSVLHWIIKHLLGWPKDYKSSLLRLMFPVAVLSPILNTATVVTLFVSVVKIWSKKLSIPPSRLLIPVCLAGNMGAVCVILVLPAFQRFPTHRPACKNCFSRSQHSRRDNRLSAYSFAITPIFTIFAKNLYN